MTRSRASRVAWLLAAWVPGLVVAASPPVKQVQLVCEAVYLPARSTWTRTVQIAYDAQRVTAVQIDGVPVHSFAVADTVILTAVDNERIQIDTATQRWSSDFRGLATAQGQCTRGA